MIARGRTLAVLAAIVGGAVSIVSSTQTWLDVALSDGAGTTLAVAGAHAFSVLAPLSLAALALGLALTVVGRILRYVFGVLAVTIGVTLVWGAARIGFGHPLDAVASAVTEATGLAGGDALAQLIVSIQATAWPFVTVAAGMLVAAGGALTLATTHAWGASGRRYRTDTRTPAPSDVAAATTAAAGPRPHDAARDRAIDSWDDLSHGEDPTADRR
ncbi:Trp biosynthesis-associated membrane protein [Microbacterium sp.]|uniref:Trp biosynthesis-associated membrane protein n=1 Tax=Microbacterium sp. TaxID=51671 RepID=UPI0039E321D9